MANILNKLKNLKPKTKGIACTALAFVVLGTGIGIYAIASDSEKIAKDNKTVTIDDKEEKAEEKLESAEKELEKAKASGDETAIKEAEKKLKNAKADVSTSTSSAKLSPAKSSANSSQSSKSNSTTNKTQTTTKTSSNSSSSSAAKVTHTHSYTIPIYSTRTVQKLVGGHSEWVCNKCGFTTTESATVFVDHKRGGKCTGSSHVNEIEDYETVTEQYISGYKCSCGAVR